MQSSKESGAKKYFWICAIRCLCTKEYKVGKKIIRYCNYYHIIINYPMIDLMLSRDLFLILTRVNDIKKNALKRVHSHQSLSTHYWLAGIWHQISIVLIHYVKSVIRIYMYLLQHSKQMLMFFAILEERYSISIRKRERV